jgi:hypothetical protein
MRIATLTSLLILAACASGGGPAGGGAPASQTLGVVSPSGTINMTVPGADRSNTQSVPFTVDAVWHVLPAAYDSLGIPVRTLDQVQHTIGNDGFSVRRRLKSTPLSRFIDCGSTQLGPSADDYDVRLSVLTQLRAVEGKTAVTTTLVAAARPANYAQDYSSCSSRGALEKLIIDAVQARLAR